MSEVMINGIDLTPPKPDVLRPGLEALVYLLRNPHMLFGWPSEQPAGCRWPVDWERLPEKLDRILERTEPLDADGICCDCVWNIRIAACVLRPLGVQICKGPMELFFWKDECGEPHVTLELNLDVSPDRAEELEAKRRHLSAYQRYPINGISLEFTSPHRKESPCRSACAI